jgi:hypothetical protein
MKIICLAKTPFKKLARLEEEKRFKKLKKELDLLEFKKKICPCSFCEMERNNHKKPPN